MTDGQESVDVFFGMLCEETGLDETATIGELMDQLKVKGWIVQTRDATKNGRTPNER